MQWKSVWDIIEIRRPASLYVIQRLLLILWLKPTTNTQHLLASEKTCCAKYQRQEIYTVHTKYPTQAQHVRLFTVNV